MLPITHPLLTITELIDQAKDIRLQCRGYIVELEPGDIKFRIRILPAPPAEGREDNLSMADQFMGEAHPQGVLCIDSDGKFTQEHDPLGGDIHQMAYDPAPEAIEDPQIKDQIFPFHLTFFPVSGLINNHGRLSSLI
jgi:hypothetical protein